MSDTDLDIVQLNEARRRFAELVAEVRPDLHRYCSRMTGSAIDGEDVVQDTLAQAFYEIATLSDPPNLRAWLFRIAHNRAVDLLRRYDRRMGESLDERFDERPDEAAPAEELMIRRDAVTAAVTRFVDLPPTQRSCVILKDVLDCSLSEIADLLETSVTAVKAALHRGRERLHVLSRLPDPGGDARPASPTVRRYADLFNARDWDGVRAMLVDDVLLDVIDGTRRTGRDKVGIYFTNYAKMQNWRVVPAWLEDREGLAMFVGSAVEGTEDARLRSFVTLEVRGPLIAAIRDFYHVRYFVDEARICLAS